MCFEWMREDKSRDVPKSDRWGDMTGWVVNHVNNKNKQ